MSTGNEAVECTCPLIDATGANGKYFFLRGDPEGCPVHETEERRAERAAAIKEARTR